MGYTRAFGVKQINAYSYIEFVCVCVCMYLIRELIDCTLQPSTFELAKREDFGSLPVIPADFIRKHGATFSGKGQKSNTTCTLL